jgi:hypothetical protein
MTRLFRFIPTVLLLLFAVSASAQTPAATTQTWSLTTSAVTLPGGKMSIMAVDSGIAFTPTVNFDLFDRNLLSNDGNFKFFGGGQNYRFPAISRKLNNVSPNVNFLRLQLSETASFGVVRLNGGAQHYGWTAGLRADYALTSGGALTLGVKAEYVQFPGVPSHVAISINPAFHF